MELNLPQRGRVSVSICGVVWPIGLVLPEIDTSLHGTICGDE